jgi:hypothetical protein
VNTARLRLWELGERTRESETECGAGVGKRQMEKRERIGCGHLGVSLELSDCLSLSLHISVPSSNCPPGVSSN